MRIIGIDPDSDKHGVAIYNDGTLIDIYNLDLMSIKTEIIDKFDHIHFSIEDVCANNFVYSRNKKGSGAIMAKIGLSIGRCQQSQTELMRMLDHYSISYELHPPQKGNWAKNKGQFQSITGWEKQSNDDTRSAAFFGYLALKGMA